MHISDPSILVIGSANAEFIVKVDGEFVPGQKNIVPLHEFVGGSGLNYTLRLLNTGFRVFPILSIGNDTIGKKIRKEIISGYEVKKAEDDIVSYIKSDNFFVPKLKSTKTFILKDKESRTIFIEQHKSMGCFKDHLCNRVQILRKDRANVKCVVIGHVQSDNVALAGADQPNATQHIIDAFYKESLIFANFGLSQIAFGAEYWEKYLKKVSILQLNIKELRAFFKHVKGVKNIGDCFKWLRGRAITAVVTLGKLGAMATYKSGKDGIIFSKALQLKEENDSIGAGDAYGAGLVSMLWNRGNFTFAELCDAMTEATYWSGYACAQVGSVFRCPDAETLSGFRDAHGKAVDNVVDIVSISQVDRVLNGFFKNEN